MSKMIFTKLHEAIAYGAAAEPQHGRSVTDQRQLNEALEFLRHLETLPHYVVDRDLRRQAISMSKSMGALKEAGVLRLPYPEMAIELWQGSSDWRMFALMEDDRDKGMGFFRVAVVTFGTIVAKGPDWGMSKVMRFDLEWTNRLPEEIPVMASDGSEASLDDAGWGKTDGWGFTAIFDEADERAFIPFASFAVMLGVLITNIRGLEREVIEPTKLNKARAKSGKPSIPTHTVLRIGHVYDKAGNRHTYDPTGRKMPVHMRAAHTRMQPHGAAWAAAHRDEIGVKPGVEEHQHLVLIEAVLVNYRDGAELPAPLPKLVRA